MFSPASYFPTRTNTFWSGWKRSIKIITNIVSKKLNIFLFNQIAQYTFQLATRRTIKIHISWSKAGENTIK